jgi:O-antigen/teichoic acid export membrane protein
MAIAILSQILPTSDFGVYAIAAVTISFGLMLGESGLLLSALRTSTLTPQVNSSVYWINATVGSILMIGVLLFARPLAATLNVLGLEPVLQVDSGATLLTGIAVQSRVLLLA